MNAICKHPARPVKPKIQTPIETYFRFNMRENSGKDNLPQTA